MCGIRIGHGYDVHKFAKDRKLILGGVDIPCEMGLLGHSDADVLVHAIMDAVLGALGKRDIGKLFPDNDDRFLGADSLVLAGETAKILKENNYVIGNIDATVIAQFPKLSPYIDRMRKNIAKAYGCDETCVNIKATTEEGLGFTGKGEGIAAHFVCLIFPE